MRALIEPDFGFLGRKPWGDQGTSCSCRTRGPVQASFRILILEDDDLLRSSLTTALELEGYEVVSVGKGVDAVELAKSEDFDLIVSDIRMPGMDGLDALAQVKGAHPEICCMVVTGY